MEMENTGNACRSTPIAVKTTSKEDWEFIILAIKEITKIENYLIRLMLIFRQEEYSIDNKKYDGRKEFEDLCKSKGIDPKKYSKMCKRCYLLFVGESIDNEDITDPYKKNDNSSFNENLDELDELDRLDKKVKSLKKKILQSANSFYLFFLGEKDGKNKDMKEFLPLRNIFFPIKSSEIGFDVSRYSKGGYFQSITKLMESNLKSFNEKNKNYQSKKNNWNSFLEKNTDNYLIRYGEFLEIIANSSYFRDFDRKNLEKFIKNWITRIDKKTGKIHVGLRDKMIDIFNENDKIGKEFSFKEEDRSKYYYSAFCLNTIYHDFRDLWYEKDIIGDENYRNIVLNNYHWQKSVVNISSFGGEHKMCAILFGENCVKFKMKVINSSSGEISVKFNLFDKEVEVKTVPNRYFGNIKIETYCGDKKDRKTGEITTEEKTGVYSINYSSDSRRKTIYEALSKEPKLRWNVSKNRLELDPSLTNIKEVGSKPIDFHGPAKFYKTGKNKGKERTDITSTQAAVEFLKSSYNKYNWDQYEFVFRAMGVDVGMKNPFCSTIAEVEKSKNDDVKINVILQEKNWKNKNDWTSEYYEVLNECDCLIALIKKTKKYYYNNKSFKNVSSTDFESSVIVKNSGGKRISLSWAKELNIDQSKYFEELKSLPIPYENCPHIVAYWLRYFNGTPIKWIIKDKLHEIAIKFKKIKNNSDRSDPQHNMVDGSFFIKLKAVKKYIELQQCIGNQKFVTGKETQDLLNGNVLNQDISKRNHIVRLQDYYNGLKRHIKTYISSAIVNQARKYNVKLIILENLSMDNSNDKEDNILRSLWSPMELLKSLKDKAEKHQILVGLVNPYLTSQIDAKTGLLGERKEDDKRNLIVNRNNQIEIIDADLNASENILIQGITAETSIINIPVNKIDPETIMTCTDGKIKSGFLHKHFKCEKEGENLTFKIVKGDINIKDFKKVSKREEREEREGKKETYNTKDKYCISLTHCNEILRCVKHNLNKNDDSEIART